MKVDLKNILNKTLEVLVPRNKEEMLKKALLVSLRVSYMTFFDSLKDDESLSDEQLIDIHNWIDDLPISIVDNRYIDCDINHQLLFLNHGHYICFYNNDRRWFRENISKWKFQSSHDSCWRDDAYRDLETIDRKIRTAMANIKSKIDNVSCAPINIVSNFSNYNCLEVIDINGYKGSYGNGYSDYPEFTLTLSADGNTLIADDRLNDL